MFILWRLCNGFTPFILSVEREEDENDPWDDEEDNEEPEEGDEYVEEPVEGGEVD